MTIQCYQYYGEMSEVRQDEIFSALGIAQDEWSSLSLKDRVDLYLYWKEERERNK